MSIRNQRPAWLSIGLALTLSWIGGCQTYFPETGQTLPTGNYLKHPPQFIPPSPTFPLAHEEANLEKATNEANQSALPPR